MKHSKLHGIAHNFADSLAGGISFVVPDQFIQTNVFEEASANGIGHIIVDFLTGDVQGAVTGGDVENAIPMFKDAFPAFCEKHGVDVAEYRAFIVRYVFARIGITYIVTVEDRDGKRSSREYIGLPGKRTRELDASGRHRPKHLSEPVD